MSTKVTLTNGDPVPEDGSHRELRPDGQQKGYVVLSEEERAQGFIRPVRDSYQHVGIRPKYPLRELTEEEHARFDQYGYVGYEEYPTGSSGLGRFWKARELSSGCGTVTTMGRALAETYARQPDFYGSTYCVGCGTHLPVGETGEFVWAGTDERVGT